MSAIRVSHSRARAPFFIQAARRTPGIHATAHVDSDSTIGQGCQIDAGAKIGRNVTIGEGCHIEANVVICDGVSIGRDCFIGANGTIRHALIGSRVRIGSNSCIGGEGFGFVPTPKGLLRQTQLGRVIIEDDVEIGSSCAVDRGALGDTVIRCGTVIDNLVQIAHNVRIGRHCVLAAQVGIAGSSEIGDSVMIGGQVAIIDHVKVGANARIAARSGIMRDVPDGEAWGGTPAVPIRQWHRQTAALARLIRPKPKELLKPEQSNPAIANTANLLALIQAAEAIATCRFRFSHHLRWGERHWR